MSDSTRIPIDKIVFPPENLGARPIPKEKDKDYSDFLVLCEDISNNGIMNTPSVSDMGDGNYMVIDGSRRCAAVKKTFDEGVAHESYADGTMAVNVRNEKELEILERSIAGNATVKRMKNSAYLKGLQKLANAKGYTIAQLSKVCGLHEAYTTSLLRLNALPKEAKGRIDSGELSLSNAILLNKLPSEEAAKLLDDACALSGEPFALKVADAQKAIKASRQAEKGEKQEFKPKAKIIAKDEVIAELERMKTLVSDEPNDFNRGRLHEIQLICQMDENSIAKQKEEFDAKKAKAEEEAKVRKEKREVKKTEEAKAHLEKLGIKVG